MTRLLVAVALLICLGACTPASDDRDLAVLAGASLQQSFQQITERFEREHPGTTVQLHFAGSATLVEQVSQGARVDVLALADQRTMSAAVERGLVSGVPQAFAANDLAIAVAPGNPRNVADLADLASMTDLDVVVCAPNVPCGAATEQVLSKSGVTLQPVSEELSVTDVLAKVTAGQADAGLVYVSDISRAAGRVEGLPIPASHNVTNIYPVVATSDKELAQDFLQYLTSPVGMQLLEESGFQRPDSASDVS